MSNQRHIGILGGTFDPPHKGHLAAAYAALASKDCAEIMFLPTAAPPHKTVRPHATPEQRLHMVELAISDEPRFRVNDLEIQLGGISFSVETARRLTSLHPDCRFSWVIVADMVQILPKWVEIEELCRMVSFIGLARPGYTPDFDELPAFLQGNIQMVPIVPVDISSSLVRDLLRRRESVREWLLPSVIRYIEENGLYED